MTLRRHLLVWALVFAGILCLGQQPRAWWQSVPQVSVGGGVVPITAPTDLSGLVLWLDAADSGQVTIETGVVLWNDKSSASNEVGQATGALQPTYISAALNGLNVVRFNGSTQYLSSSTSAMLRAVAGWSIFVVGKATTTGGVPGFYIFISSDGGGSARAALGTGVVTSNTVYIRGRRQDADSGVNVEGSPAFGTGYGYFTGIGDYTNTTGQIYQNGSLVGNNTSWLTSGNSDNDFGLHGVGNSPTPGAGALAGDIAEIIVYDNAKSSGDRQRVELYLKNKWGL